MIAKGKSTLHQTIDLQHAVLSYFVACKDDLALNAKSREKDILAMISQGHEYSHYSSEMSFIEEITEGNEVNNMLLMFIYAYFETNMLALSRYVGMKNAEFPSIFNKNIRALSNDKWKKIRESYIASILGERMKSFRYIKRTVRYIRNEITHEKTDRDNVTDETLRKTLFACHEVLSCIITTIDGILIEYHKSSK